MTWFTQEQKQSANSGSFEMGGGEPIPANTVLPAMIDEAGWEEYQGARFIKLRWVVYDGEHKNRKVFQKLHVTDSAKRDRAMSMLAAIDANCGGKLMTLETEPTQTDLMSALLNKPMHIKVDVWETDDGKKGNWVAAVAPNKPNAAPAAAAPEGEHIPF